MIPGLGLAELRVKRVYKPPYRKPESIKELERLENYRVKQKFPNVPYRSNRTFRDDSANDLTKCITAYIKLKGGFSSRINTVGIYRPKIGKFIPSTQRKGIGDIWATYKGKSIQIEVKYSNDRQSKEQKKIEQEQTRAGGLYFVASNFTDFKKWFDLL